MALNKGSSKQDIMLEWVVALRSGDYPQGVSALHSYDGDSYCCLGVLCEVAVKAGVISPGLRFSNESSFSYDGDRNTLPYSVIQWAGLTRNDPILPFEPSPNANWDMDYDDDLQPQVSCINMNDQMRLTFDQIADVIQHFWEDL